MRVLHWCMMGVAILLLLCEVVVSQVCKSLITLVDGFHTLYLLMQMASPSLQTASVKHTQLSSSDAPASSLAAPSSSSAPSLAAPSSSSAPSLAAPSSSSASSPAVPSSSSASSPPAPSSSSASSPPAPSSSSSEPPCSSEASVERLPGNLTAADGSPPRPHQLSTLRASPAALDCGLSYTDSRIRPVGALISALVLACLNISYLIEVINFMLDPWPVQQPLLLVVVGAVNLLFKMLVLGLSWDRMRGDRVGRDRETESHIEVNHRVLAEEETKGPAERGGVLDSISEVEPAVDDSFHNGALVLCNPDSLSVPDSDPPVPTQPGGEASSGVAALDVCAREAPSRDVAEISKDSTCAQHLDRQNASKPSPVCTSSHPTKIPVPTSQLSVRLLPFVLIVQDLLTPVLVLINSLVMLKIGPTCLPSSEPCSGLVYMDPVLSLLAVMILTAKAIPEALRYGLLLLQSTPPQICVSDLGQRIAGVPGVQAVHDLHIWQLTDSFIVASVHIHCHAGFPVYRCAEVLLGVTKVLQSVGVSCCTVQPEFAACAAPSAGSQGDGGGEAPSTAPLQTCSLVCGKACAGSMCCAVLEEGCRGLSAPPAGETKEEPQTLVIENNFHFQCLTF